MKYMYLILLLLLVGCNRNVPKEQCHNETFYVNNTIIKEVIKECPVYEPQICPAVKDTINDTMKMIYRLDYCQEQLNDCWAMNQTLFAENLSSQLRDCNNALSEYKKEFGNI